MTLPFLTDKELDEIEAYMREDTLLTPVTSTEVSRLIAAARERVRLAAERIGWQVLGETIEPYRQPDEPYIDAVIRLASTVINYELFGVTEMGDVPPQDADNELAAKHAKLLARELRVANARIGELVAENERLLADMSAAAGELTVPIPEPGTDAAKLLSANVLLRRELAEAREGYHALERNWHTVHEAAMSAIRAQLGLPEATVFELCQRIKQIELNRDGLLLEAKREAKFILEDRRRAALKVLRWLRENRFLSDTEIQLLHSAIEHGTFDGGNNV